MAIKCIWVVKIKIKDIKIEDIISLHVCTVHQQYLNTIYFQL
jgi:hypothetical protein